MIYRRRYMNFKEGQRCQISRFPRIRKVGSLGAGFPDTMMTVECGQYIYHTDKALYNRAKISKKHKSFS
jgi:hypothetical protein